MDKFNLEVTLSLSDFRKVFFNFLPKKLLWNTTWYLETTVFTVDKVFHVVFMIVFACYKFRNSAIKVLYKCQQLLALTVVSEADTLSYFNMFEKLLIKGIYGCSVK